VAVDTGQLVSKGQTLALLENTDLAAQISDTRSRLSQATAAVSGAEAAQERIQLELASAEDNLARIKELYESGAATLVAYEQARLQVETTGQRLDEQISLLDSARAQTEGLTRSLGQLADRERQLVVQSPVDGTVLDLPVKQEQVLNPGALIATVAQADRLEVKADILSDDLAELEVGQRATITAPVLGEKILAGEVIKIYPKAEEKQSALGIIQRRVPVMITLEEPANLKPGYEVRVAIETLRKQNISILPRESVRSTKDGQREVMVVVDGRVQHRQISTGISNREYIEITDGLKTGDLVVRDGSLNLGEQAKVR
jgi:HlyD family secretion protein